MLSKFPVFLLLSSNSVHLESFCSYSVSLTFSHHCLDVLIRNVGMPKYIRVQKVLTFLKERKLTKI